MRTAPSRRRRCVAEGVLGISAVLAVGDALWPGRGTDAILGGVSLLAVVASMLCRSARERVLPAPAATPAVLGCTWLATYACVPETSDQMFHVAALLVVLGATEALTRSTFPWWAHAGATAVVAWAGMYGSAGRATAVVGALFALWPLVLPALTVAVVPELVHAPAWVRWGVVLIASSASLVCARSGALGALTWHAVEDAAVGAIVSTAAALPLAAWAAQRTGVAAGAASNIGA